MNQYKERLNQLFVESKFKQVKDISTPTDGYFPSNDKNGIIEFMNWAKTFMKMFDIGRYLKKDKWGSTKIKQIQNVLYKTIKPKNGEPEEISAPKSPLQVYDDIKKVDKSNNFTNYDFERVARTETARIKAAYQLLKYKEAGLKYVKHVTKNDDRVSDICKLHNNREFKIDYLLNHEEHRIPLHVNCRCRYVASMKGLQ